MSTTTGSLDRRLARRSSNRSGQAPRPSPTPWRGCRRAATRRRSAGCTSTSRTFPTRRPSRSRSHFRGAPYDGEVAAADAALAPLLDPLLSAGRASDTLVVLTSDHGESLGEHGEATHGIFAYEATLRVPLILYAPGSLAPRVVDAPVRHVDILPTILDALGVPTPPGLRGSSLISLARGTARPDHALARSAARSTTTATSKRCRGC